MFTNDKPIHHRFRKNKQRGIVLGEISFGGERGLESLASQWLGKGEVNLPSGGLEVRKKKEGAREHWLEKS